LDGPANPAAPTRRRLPAPWAKALAGLVVAAVLAGAVLTVVQVRGRMADETADRSALEAGRQAAVSFTSYDYRHLDTDLNRVASRSTGRFRQQFTHALGALTEAIRKAKGVSKGVVQYAGLVSRQQDRAVVIAAVDAQVTNTATADPTQRRYRLRIVLDHSTGRWLISDVSPVV
jgi:Mce-associated membrane protein